MKRVFILFFCFFKCAISPAQEIVNLVLVGANGVTENIKEANSFIVVKKYPNSFQRLDYKISEPLQKMRNYSDVNLTILEGKYLEYGADGTITKSGYYQNNFKEKDWHYYNDTGKVILTEKFEKGLLIETINPDTVKKDEKKSDTFTKVESEATFEKGDKDWKKYLVKNLNGDVGNKSVKGGKVVVQFVVNTSGKCVDVFMQKSVEFVLDEEAIRIIENSPLWQPAFQDGRKVNAYRRQPITFAKSQD